MPLAIRYEEALCVPIVICDHCGEEIRSAADGNYQWLGRDDRPSRVYFTHKGCCHAFEKRHGGFWGAIDLQLLPVYLGNNLGIDWKESRRMANYFSRF
jgi:hypothetical protein